MSESTPGLLKVIGAGLDSASSRLAKLSGASWMLETVSVRQFDAGEYASTFSRDAEEGFGVLFTVPGVSFVVFFSHKSSGGVCRAFLGKGYAPSRDREAMGEIANIVANAVADAIGDATGDLLLLTAPRVVEGERSEVMMRALETFTAGGKPSPVVSQIHLSAETLSADCSLVLLMTSPVRAKLEAAARPKP